MTITAMSHRQLVLVEDYGGLFDRGVRGRERVLSRSWLLEALTRGGSCSHTRPRYMRREKERSNCKGDAGRCVSEGLLVG